MSAPNPMDVDTALRIVALDAPATSRAHSIHVEVGRVLAAERDELIDQRDRALVARERAIQQRDELAHRIRAAQAILREDAMELPPSTGRRVSAALRGEGSDQ